MTNGKVLQFNENDIIIQQGDQCATMYKILSGHVEVYVHHGEEDEYLLGVLGKDRCFGEMCVLGKQPSPYTVIAYEPIAVLCIEQDYLEDFVSIHYKYAIDIMRNMVNTIESMSLNLNLLLDELSRCRKIDRQEARRVEMMIKRYACMNIEPLKK